MVLNRILIDLLDLLADLSRMIKMNCGDVTLWEAG